MALRSRRVLEQVSIAVVALHLVEELLGGCVVATRLGILGGPKGRREDVLGSRLQLPKAQRLRPGQRPFHVLTRLLEVARAKVRISALQRRIDGEVMLRPCTSAWPAMDASVVASARVGCAAAAVTATSARAQRSSVRSDARVAACADCSATRAAPRGSPATERRTAWKRSTCAISPWFFRSFATADASSSALTASSRRPASAALNPYPLRISPYQKSFCLRSRNVVSASPFDLTAAPYRPGSRRWRRCCRTRSPRCACRRPTAAARARAGSVRSTDRTCPSC